MTAPIVAGYTDANPCPRVEVDLPAVAGAVKARVWRTYNGQRALVRGGDGIR